MKKLSFEIYGCQDCPYFVYDGECTLNHYCNLTNNNPVKDNKNWNGEQVDIPEWCPLGE